MRGFIGQAAAALPVALLTVLPASADPFFFSTGNVTNSIATATRPESTGKFEIESADDFVLTAPTANCARKRAFQACLRNPRSLLTESGKPARKVSIPIPI
jgi:hypothetical protein